jgi:putative DNA primase/helicase
MALNPHQSATEILRFWNPTGAALAAEYWKNRNAEGFSPVCANKFKEGVCGLKAGEKCRYCESKKLLQLTEEMIGAHISGKTRMGIYPLLQGALTAWIAADFDDHTGQKDPAKDLESLVRACQALDVPLFVFNSNSGKGYHTYIFFETPVSALKARSLKLTLIDRAGIDISHRKDESGSFDCIFPKQDSLRNGSIGNLIALPWNGRAVKERKSTLLLDPHTLQPFGNSLKENIEIFQEYYRPLSESGLDSLLNEMGVQIGGGTPLLSGKKNESLGELIEKCAFLKHCKDNAAALPENQWYAMAAILAHQFGGLALIHELSKPYTKDDGYSFRETQDKIVHILNDQAGPLTCQYIKTIWDCQSDCGVMCPIHLLRQDKSTTGAAQSGKDVEFSPEELLDAAYSGQDGDAEVFVKMHKGRLCFDHAAGRWFIFERHYWREDLLNEALAAIDHVTELYEKEAMRLHWAVTTATKAGRVDEAAKAEKDRGAFLKKISSLQKVAWKHGVLQLAASGKGSLGITGDEWDREPWLLPCINGVVSLRDGSFRDGQPEDYFKTVCPTEWKGLDEPAPKWERFQSSIFADDEIPSFNQRLYGASLPGAVIEHVLPVRIGEGFNGKGTEHEVLKHVLGGLAGPIPSELLLKQQKSKDPDAPSSSLMALRGKRIVWASETEKGRHFSIARIKWLVGGDTLVARDPFGRRQVEFSPTHSLFLLTNHKPRADASDKAFWGRMLLIPYAFTFSDDPSGPYQKKRDLHLGESVKAEAPGILAWMIRGCLKWQKQGLNPPEIVRESTEEYRQSEDQLGRFLDDCCRLDSKEEVKSSVLLKAYQVWCDTVGEKPMSGRTFGEEMGKRFDSYRKGTGWHYLELRFRREDET